MLDINTIINTCYETTNTSRVIASYSHIIPVILSLILAVFVFFKSKFNLFSKVFLAFITLFSVWLIGDFILWTQNDYLLIYASWAPLDFIEIVFYILGIYFAIISVNQKDMSKWGKIILFIFIIPAFWITITGHSVSGFNQAVCEALNNESLGVYKLLVEGVLLLVLLFYIVRVFYNKNEFKKKKANLVVLISMFLFLSTFGITEYLASITGYYEMNLYSLFLLPVFLISIIYSVFELDIFNFHILGTYYLVIGLDVLIAGQLFFVNNSTDRLLTVITLILTLALSIILIRNLKKESDQRVFIEKLSTQLENSNLQLEGANDKLKSVDKLKTEFLSLASHQLRSPLTAIMGYSSLVLDGSFGAVDDKQKEALDRIFQSSRHLAKVVEDLLNVSKIEQGGMQYVKAPFDFEKAAKDLVTDLSITAQKKGLTLTFETDNKSPYTINGDMEKIRQVVLNFVDNSIKYTKEGNINVLLQKIENKIRLSITDTGMGMTSEMKEKLFQKFARGEGAKVNTSGSGLGLYLAKKIIEEGHTGKVGVDSPGAGLGSTFWMELDVA